MSLESSQITVVGGLWGLCHKDTVEDALNNYKGKGPLTIRFPLDGIYTEKPFPEWLLGPDPAGATSQQLQDIVQRYVILKLELEKQVGMVSLQQVFDIANPAEFMRAFMDASSIPVPPNKRYRYEVLLNGVLHESIGNGESVVRFSLESRNFIDRKLIRERVNTETAPDILH